MSSFSGIVYIYKPLMLSCIHVYTRYIYIHTHTHAQAQGVSRLVDITAGGDFLGLCDQKSSYKNVSNFGRLQSYDPLKFRIEGNDY